MSSAVSARTNVPASETPDSALDPAELRPVPEVETSLAKGSSKYPDELMKAFSPPEVKAVVPPKACTALGSASKASV